MLGDRGFAGHDGLPFEADAGRVEDAARRLRQLRTDAVAGDEGHTVGHGPIVAAAGVTRPAAERAAGRCHGARRRQGARRWMSTNSNSPEPRSVAGDPSSGRQMGRPLGVVAVADHQGRPVGRERPRVAGTSVPPGGPAFLGPIVRSLPDPSRVGDDELEATARRRSGHTPRARRRASTSRSRVDPTPADIGNGVSSPVATFSAKHPRETGLRPAREGDVRPVRRDGDRLIVEFVVRPRRRQPPSLARAIRARSRRSPGSPRLRAIEDLVAVRWQPRREVRGSGADESAAVRRRRRRRPTGDFARRCTRCASRPATNRTSRDSLVGGVTARGSEPSAFATTIVRIAGSVNGPSERRKTILVPSREKIGEKSKASRRPGSTGSRVVVRIDQEDVAVAAGDDQAVARQPERVGQPGLPCADGNDRRRRPGR